MQTQNHIFYQGTLKFDKRDNRKTFEEYDQEHPKIYELFKKFAIQLMANGKKHYGAKSIMERIRWHFDVDERGDDFKINNNYTSRYVRKLIAEHPMFENFFFLRELKS